MTTRSADVVVVGAGTAGTVAAATAASEGHDVALLERGPPVEADGVACGDVIESVGSLPPVLNRERLRADAVVNDDLGSVVLDDPTSDRRREVSLEGDSPAIVDRERFAEGLQKTAAGVGADVAFGIEARELVQSNGRVTGVVATDGDETIEYEAAVTVDATGVASGLQETADFAASSFEPAGNGGRIATVHQAVVDVADPVERPDEIVVQPTADRGICWIAPRTPTTLDVGVAIRSSGRTSDAEEPASGPNGPGSDAEESASDTDGPTSDPADALHAVLGEREELRGATVETERSGTVPCRRPSDSAVAPGFVAVGDAAGHVSPLTGTGTASAAKAGHWAAEAATRGLSHGAIDEGALWEYNSRVMADFGARFAAMDLFDRFAASHDVAEMEALSFGVPERILLDVCWREGTADVGVQAALTALAGTVGHWRTLYAGYRVNDLAGELRSVYDDYPGTPDGFPSWRERRDAVHDDVSAVIGTDPSY